MSVKGTSFTDSALASIHPSVCRHRVPGVIPTEGRSMCIDPDPGGFPLTPPVFSRELLSDSHWLTVLHETAD